MSGCVAGDIARFVVEYPACINYVVDEYKAGPIIAMKDAAPASSFRWQSF
jgi:hypothetical protein